MSAPSRGLVLEDVAVALPGVARRLLDGVHLHVRPGERLALLGRNGAGKTTLLQVPVGLVPFTGRVEVDGLVVGPWTLGRARRRVGYLFASPEDQILFPRVLDDVRFGVSGLGRNGMREGDANARARAALARMGVAHLADADPSHLSHGEKTRVAMAGVLAREPRVLLLDEPSAPLDPPGKRALARDLAALPAATVLATHDLAFARACATHFALLDEGRVTRSGPVEALPEDPDELWPEDGADLPREVSGG